LCDGEANGICTRTCVTDVDCGAGLVCAGVRYSNIAAAFCAPACNTESDCGTGRACSLSVNGSAAVQSCAEDQAGCASGLTGANNACTTICALDGDCPAGQSCIDVDIGLTPAVTASVSVCAP
jgi:hypothetical protein